MVGYRVATFVPSPAESDESQAAAWLPEFSIRNGKLVLERGLHQEIGWTRQTDASEMSVTVFSDAMQNPVLEAMSGPAGEDENGALVDNASGMMRAAGPNYTSQGITARYDRRLPGGNNLRLSYGSSNALVMPALPRPAELAQVLGAAHPRYVQTYSISLSGTLDGTGTRWRASYRWQPEDTVTEVAPYAEDASQPYMNIRLRQPIHVSRDGCAGIEALLDVRNLLAQGYHPFLLRDGSMVVFAQGQRSIRGGLAITF